jgi:hypothetical protein
MAMNISPHIAEAAQRSRYEPAVIAAIVAVESRGDPFGPDGRPIILYEPHVAWRVAPEPMRQTLAAADLAWPQWRRDRYPTSQAARWEQFDRCADIASPDVAIQACSWGMGQVLGENWSLCNFATPAAFRAAQDTRVGQIDTIIRYLEGCGLRSAINARDWTAIARAYNGPRHAEHDYAGRMERAYRQITGAASPVVLRIGDRGPAVKRLQTALEAAGHDLGAVDGAFGPETAAALRAYQAQAGLRIDAVAGAQTWAALERDTARRPTPQYVDTPTADAARRTAKAGGAAITAASVLDYLGALEPVIEAARRVMDVGAEVGLSPQIVAGALAVAALVYGAGRLWPFIAARTAELWS